MGNNRPIDNSYCSNTCTGDAAKKCGGSDALNLYVKDNYQYTVGPASVLQSYNGYSVTQCWQYVFVYACSSELLITVLNQR